MSEFTYRYVPGPLITKARNLLGQFQGMNQQALEAHQRMARNLSDRQVEILEQRVAETGRPQRRTQYLAHALRDPARRRVNQDGFAVWGEEYLNTSAAADYWENLERGSDVFVDRRIAGWFILPGGFLEGPMRGSKSAVKLGQVDPADNPRAPQFTIRNPIPAYEYLSNGIDGYLDSGDIQHQYAEALGRFRGVLEIGTRGLSAGEKRQRSVTRVDALEARLRGRGLSISDTRIR